MSTLAYKMYEIIDTFMEEIIDMKWANPKGKLALFGGIMINCDGQRTDMFLPLKFEVVSKNGSRKDMFSSTFGTSPYRYLKK